MADAAPQPHVGRGTCDMKGFIAASVEAIGVVIYAAACLCMAALVVCSCSDCGSFAFLVQFSACPLPVERPGPFPPQRGRDCTGRVAHRSVSLR